MPLSFVPPDAPPRGGTPIARPAAFGRFRSIAPGEGIGAARGLRALLGGLLAAACSLGLATDAEAVAITFAVDASQPAKQVAVAIGIYPASGSLEVGGTLDAEIDVAGGSITAFDPVSADLSISDLTIVFGPASDVFSLRDVTATLTGPPALLVGGAGETSRFDLSGSKLVFVSGRARVCCTGGSGQLDFALSPVEFLYGPGSLAELTSTPVGDGTFAVSALLPLTLDTVYPPPPAPAAVRFSMSMDLSATGLAASGFAVVGAAVPEPATGVLLGLGLLGLAARARERRRRGIRASR